MGATKKKPNWRKSDQTNADLPVGRTWIDDCGRLTELIVDSGYADLEFKNKVWVAYPYGCVAFHIVGEGPGDIVSKWDKNVSYERR